MNFCLTCLAFDVKLYSLDANNQLNTSYEQLTGLKVQSFTERSYACYQCFALFCKYVKFREKCYRASSVLGRIWKENGMIKKRMLLSQRKLQSLDFPLNITKNTITIDINCVHTSDEDITDGGTNSEKKDEMLLHSTKIHISELSAVKQENYDTNFQCEQSDNSVSNEKFIHFESEKKTEAEKPFECEDFFSETKPKPGFREEFVTKIILSQKEQREELKAREFTLNYKNCPMKCEFCFKGFLDEDAFKNHMAKHEKSAGTFVCSVCMLRYTNARRLHEHTATAHARRFRCKKCGHLSHTTGQARVHENWHRGVTFQCQLCGETFTKPTTHLNHMRKKHPTNNACQICGLSFLGKHGLVMHKKKMHANMETKHFGNKTEDKQSEKIEKMENDIDKEDRDRYCKECNICFVTKSALMRHVMSSSEHALESKCGNICRICGEAFLTRILLTRHSRMHAPREPRARISCNECDATFASGAGVRVHRASAHGVVDKSSEQRCYVCDICGKTCRSNAVLQYHLRTHTGERPYPCPNCPKRFPDKTQLSLHARTHSGERPYACSKCPAKFKQKGALNRHFKMHTGEKPHSCSVCLKTFSRMSTLKNHVFSVHSTELNDIKN